METLALEDTEKWDRILNRPDGSISKFLDSRIGGAMSGRMIRVRSLLILSGFLLLSGCQISSDQKEKSKMRVHYVEVVCKSVNEQCEALTKVHGLSFGSPNADLGQARVAETSNGSMIGVRAPLAEHEQPTTRTYFAVEDISKAVKAAEAEGAIIAYPPTKQGDSGTWAIYILDGIQYGLWQR